MAATSTCARGFVRIAGVETLGASARPAGNSHESTRAALPNTESSWPWTHRVAGRGDACLPDCPWAQDAPPDEAKCACWCHPDRTRVGRRRGPRRRMYPASVALSVPAGRPCRRNERWQQLSGCTAARVRPAAGRDRTPRPGLELLAYSLDLWPQDLVVRRAEPCEYDAVGELTVAAYRGDGFLSGDIDYVGSLRDAASRAKHADLLVALPDEATHAHPAGTVTFCRPGSRYAELSVDGEAEFRMLAVDSRYRGRGVGETLVRACDDLARNEAADAWSAARAQIGTPRNDSTRGSLRPRSRGGLQPVPGSTSSVTHWAVPRSRTALDRPPPGHRPSDQPSPLDGGYLELQQPDIDGAR